MARPIFKDGIGYEGKVKLTLKSKERVLSTKTYKNKGTSQLFSFLGHCLIGSYTEAEKKLLPSKVMLLYNKAAGVNIKSENISARSSFVGFAQIPTIVNSGNEVLVTYTFEIPRSAIEDSFNQIALYGAGITDNEIDKFSAYYTLTDVDGNVSAQNPKDWSSTTILLIEWELSLSNKTVEIYNNNEEEEDV